MTNTDSPNDGRVNALLTAINAAIELAEFQNRLISGLTNELLPHVTPERQRELREQLQRCQALIEVVADGRALSDRDRAWLARSPGRPS